MFLRLSDLPSKVLLNVYNYYSIFTAEENGRHRQIFRWGKKSRCWLHGDLSLTLESRRGNLQRMRRKLIRGRLELDFEGWEQGEGFESGLYLEVTAVSWPALRNQLRYKTVGFHLSTTQVCSPGSQEQGKWMPGCGYSSSSSPFHHLFRWPCPCFLIPHSWVNQTECQCYNETS